MSSPIPERSSTDEEAVQGPNVAPDGKASVQDILNRRVSLPRFISDLPMFSGRIDRTGYWLGWLYRLPMIPLPLIGIWFIRSYPDQWLQFVGAGWGLGFFTAAVLLVVAIGGLSELSLIIRRGHDLAGTNALGERPSFAGLQFAPGNPQLNRYGPPIHSRNPLVVLGLRPATPRVPKDLQ
ncbi:DUF805 domain-containing protein [Nocardia fluminea]|uniref:DUF805 domain-containing protein n=1 Tax=Nocardia fluminea TaxID=134984 RepID=UPI00365DEE44